MQQLYYVCQYVGMSGGAPGAHETRSLVASANQVANGSRRRSRSRRSRRSRNRSRSRSSRTLCGLGGVTSRHPGYLTLTLLALGYAPLSGGIL